MSSDAYPSPRPLPADATASFQAACAVVSTDTFLPAAWPNTSEDPWRPIGVPGSLLQFRRMAPPPLMAASVQQASRDSIWNIVLGGKLFQGGRDFRRDLSSMICRLPERTLAVCFLYMVREARTVPYRGGGVVFGRFSILRVNDVFR